MGMRESQGLLGNAGVFNAERNRGPHRDRYQEGARVDATGDRRQGRAWVDTAGDGTQGSKVVS